MRRCFIIIRPPSRTSAGRWSWHPTGTGVTLSGSTTTSTFDDEDRLTGIGANVTYSYIGAGTDRYNKTVSGTTTQFLYDEGSVDEEMQGTTVTAVYSAGAEKLSGTLYWMLQDGQGSARQLLNSSQSTVASYTTDAFRNSVSSSGTAANPFQWNGGSGYYSDSESGLQKVGARYYEPATGRWISQDSLLVAGSPADSQAVNRYLYCGADPVNGADPLGNDPNELMEDHRAIGEAQAAWFEGEADILTGKAQLNYYRVLLLAAARITDPKVRKGVVDAANKFRSGAMDQIDKGEDEKVKATQQLREAVAKLWFDSLSAVADEIPPPGAAPPEDGE
jgi:RHS repeat-associated protein